VDNTIDFGAQEAFIAVPESTFGATTFLRPVTGSGGLTLYGIGTVAFPGGNQISGELVLNGSVHVQLTDAAQLGPDLSEIQVNGRDIGAGFVIGDARVVISRPIRVNDGYLFAGAPHDGSELTLNGGIAGPGGLYVAPGLPNPLGYTVLAGQNTYTGPTAVEGRLAFASDAALGNTSAIILPAGTIKLLGNWTTARRLQPSALSNSALTLDTNGYDAIMHGLLAHSSFTQPPILKKGAGRLIFPVPQDEYAGNLTVAEGEVIVQDTGRLPNASLTVTGGTFIVDNRPQVAPRDIEVGLFGGEFKVFGHPTQPTTMGSGFFAGGSYSTATIVPQGSAAVTLNLAFLSARTDAYLLVRGDQLGTAATGAYTRLRLNAAPTLTNGILPRILVDDSSAGSGAGFATYDSGSDAAGVIGVRALNPAELTATSELRNPANGGATLATANFLAAGEVGVTGAANTVNTLTLDPGSKVAMSPGQSLAVTQNMLLVRPGAPAEITGGIFQATAAAPAGIFGAGELRLGATVPDDGAIELYGPGTLTVLARQATSRFTVSGGTLRAGPGDPLRNARIRLNDSGRLEVVGGSTRIPQLDGSGTVDLNAGTLSVSAGLSSGFTASTFAGRITGAGTFESAGKSGVTLTGHSPFNGTLAVKGGALTLNGTAPNVSLVSVASGSFALYPSNDPASPSLGSAAVDLGSSIVNVYVGNSADSTTLLGPLSGRGLNYVLLYNHNTASTPTAARLAFASLARQDRGVFAFGTSASTHVVPNTARIDFTADLGSQLIGDPSVAAARPVLPYAVVNGRPATFEPGVGLRALAASEQTTAFTAGQNLRVTSSTPALNAELTVNSLETESSASLFGSGSLHVTSGLVVGSGTVYTALDFGAAEGVLVNLNGGRASFRGPLSGTNGLTVAGDSELRGSNTFTGPLTVNGVSLYYHANEAFGPDRSAISLRNATISYTGSAGITITRPLDLAAGTNNLAQQPFLSGPITVSGVLSGPGHLLISGDVTLSNPANSYSGDTTVNGTLRLPSDAVLGQSPTVAFSSGSPESIILMGPWTTNRTVLLQSAGLGTIDTAGFSAVLNGTLVGNSTLVKAGAGSLTITDADEFTGGLTVNAGAVRLHGAVPGTGSMTVAAGGRLEGDASFPTHPLSLGGTLAPGDGLGIVETGNLTLQGGSTLELELASPASFDQVRITGAVTFSGLVQLSLDLGGGTLGGNFHLPILLNDGSDLISISATKGFTIGGNVLDEGEDFTIGEQMFRITYAGGDGNDVVLAVPEPAAATLLALGLAPLLLRHRRRKL
jgi:fibronectin-binding autotransporter adhesin